MTALALRSTSMPAFSLKKLWSDLVARVSGRAQAGARAPMTVVLDRALPDALREQVFSELLYDPDPNRVLSAAQALAPQWPCAAWELRNRAWRLRGQPPGQAPGPRPACAPAPASSVSLEASGICQSIDPTLTASDCAPFYAALTDPQSTSATLSAYATSLAAAHPAAAAALQTRASFLAQQEAVAAQASGAVPSAAEPFSAYTKPEVNVPTADSAIAEAALLSPRVPDNPGGDGAAYQVPTVRARPQTAGGCVLVYRDTDHAWPAQVAKAGGGSKNQIGQLARMNPHLLAPDGTLQRFTPGTEVNVPCAWEANLVAAGFKLRRD